MDRLTLSGLIVYNLPLLITGALVACSSSSHPSGPTAHRLDAAAASQAPAHPAQPRRLLVYSACKGFRHTSIPTCTAALQKLGQDSGAFEVVVAEEPDVFRPENLAKFDAICFNNTTGELFEEGALRQSLLDFVRNGKGIVGIHAATDCFYKWPEFGALMGGYFDGHPWNESVTVKIDDPAHPVNAPFGGRPFEIADEIYQFKEPYSRANLRVLLSLDTSRTDMKKAGIRRADGDFAVSWVRNYGLGRVFYCSLGHREEVFENPLVMQHYLAGIRFALGDLPADAMPSAGIQPDGSRDLFDGETLAGWFAKPGSWGVEDGALARKGGGDIWTEQPFGDFVLDLEFKVAPQANSGIFIRTANIKDCVQTGIEVQVLDSYGKTELGRGDCGAIYDCVAPSKNAVKPPGEWNRCVIMCAGSKIQVELNNERIIDMDLDRWTEAGKNPDGTPNKFKTAYRDMPRYGRIGFQDHGNPVWYRNIRLKPLTR